MNIGAPGSEPSFARVRVREEAAVKRYVVVALAAAIGIASIVHQPRRAAVEIATPSASPFARVHRQRPLPPYVVVYVAGAVRRPGLYRLRAGSRAFDAVALAGGLRADADAAAVNLAALLGDGDEVVAPILGAKPSRAKARGGIRSARTKSRRAKLSPGAQVDLNASDVATLQKIPGIGPEMAQRVVTFREANGAFATLDELADVAGMTQRRLDAATPFLYVAR